MDPFFDLHARVYLTAIGMEVPREGRKAAGDDVPAAEEPARVAPAGRFSRVLAWLGAALAPPAGEGPDREELSLDASRWLGL